MNTSTVKIEKKISFVDKFLNVIEKGGNALPHPATLFGILALVMVVISGIGSALGWSVEFEGINRKTMQMENMVIQTKSLMNAEGINYIFTRMVKNFTGFAPLGTVLVAIIGIGVCERSGLMAILLKKTALSTPKKLVTVMVVFLGIMSNVASDAGYVVLPPLAALIFLSFGRHPLAGLAAAFAGVSGGFSANLLIGTIDPLLGGISTEASRLLDATYEVAPTANYFFMFVSTFVIAVIGWFVTEKIVEPRLGKYEGDDTLEFDEVTPAEKKGLRAAGLATVALIICLVPLYFTLGKNFLGHGLVPIIVLFFAVPGLAYGISVGVIKSDKDVMGMISKSMATMSGYLVLVFFAAQFIAFFNYSNLGTILAVKGAGLLEATGMTGIPLIIGFILVVGILNLFMGSASAKWAILAPVFIPMLMRVGYTPEFTQLAYRIGDSTTNIISPLMSYFAMIIVFMQKYDKKGSMGTLISIMLPFSMAFLIGWSILLIVWMMLGLPIGPGIGIYM
ncbi:AbgT family transporter [Psychrilyobacter piezotolerans]|uniref:AbgT family transporter n=1 Tax=Psychrilyobacter piezotolerans TaxID=2293438 RepID=A0ABX9KKI2_9FUSO|nr:MULTISPECIES: AbgT family transporter [Psychrilyobacter]MCS5421622.1 AbgT family transporter [Psychrilyobacter sp. S5]NDI76683.1 AbgT family transporter [Psychrilyobacter piezotolerans]RDE65307.1 AbgT family transporter [Psychrilyobacter sp. S5]REI42925.1 AbgT family transporter [Psychrilyobacter piezotolerans]